MRKLILFLIAGLTVAMLSGCSSLLKSTTDKNVSLKGYGAVNIIDTGANPTTGTFTPAVTSIVGSVHHKSTIVGRSADQTTPDYNDYTREESGSIWNSKVKTVTTSFTMSASSPEAAEKYLKKLQEIDANNLQPSFSGKLQEAQE